MNDSGDRRQAIGDSNKLALKIEALLFALGRPLSIAELSKMLSAEAEEIESAVRDLQNADSGGVAAVFDGRTVELRASAQAAELIERVRKEEYSRDIGRAGLEALSAILYRGPLTRSEIDFIRGVNSSQTLRTLSMRGLIRKVPNPRDERSYLYEPTTEVLSQLGVMRKEELPDYADVREKLAALERSYRDMQQSENAENEVTH